MVAPAQVAVGSYSTIAINGDVTRNDSTWDLTSKYAGQPSLELDAAWDLLTPPSKPIMIVYSQYKCGKLTRCVVPRIKLTHEEMLRAGYDIDDAYFLEDGDHTAILNVHHQLHCLVRKYALAALGANRLTQDDDRMQSEK